MMLWDDHQYHHKPEPTSVYQLMYLVVAHHYISTQKQTEAVEGKFCSPPPRVAFIGDCQEAKYCAWSGNPQLTQNN